MSDVRRNQLAAKMLVCSYTAKDLLKRINSLEADTQLTNEEKFAQLKTINEELNKIGQEIDSVKNEIKLLNTYSVNWGRDANLFVRVPNSRWIWTPTFYYGSTRSVPPLSGRKSVDTSESQAIDSQWRVFYIDGLRLG